MSVSVGVSLVSEGEERGEERGRDGVDEVSGDCTVVYGDVLSV